MTLLTGQRNEDDFEPTGPSNAVIRTDVEHPDRPQVAPNTQLYSRQIADLDGQKFSLRTLSQSDADVELMHEWLNNPRVDKWFAEKGSREQHAAFVKEQTEDPHSLAVIGSFDADPTCFFEIYWAQEDRVSMHYGAEPYDRGIHLFVGSEKHRGPHRVKAWLTSVIDYCFKDESRTKRVLLEPHYRNDKLIDYLKGVGFVDSGTFDFPHRRARLMMLDREHFYSQNQL